MEQKLGQNSNQDSFWGKLALIVFQWLVHRTHIAKKTLFNNNESDKISDNYWLGFSVC